MMTSKAFAENEAGKISLCFSLAGVQISKHLLYRNQKMVEKDVTSSKTAIFC